ncbi:MAG: molybdate ABC transporter substrate-binding protein [Cyclobacteriaceae bacterium]|nr:MAG: molybdate ABC transporter substrate-binding protein [Cyclobacteriaceae bacterium]
MKSIIGIFCLFSLLACHQRPAADLTIAVASNMQFAMDDMVRVFENKTGLVCDLVTSSSGKLTAQIKEGAPFDLLVSADMKYPEELFRSGLSTEHPVVYAYGSLVLLSTVNNYQPVMEDLTTQTIRHIAIANPKTAPYGKAAMEVLQNYGLTDSIRHKLVFGENISQVNQFLVSGAAQIGFTAKSIALAPPMKERSRWTEIDESQYTPIAQGVVIIDNPNSARSRQFLDFLFSPEGQEVLQKYGYTF